MQVAVDSSSKKVSVDQAYVASLSQSQQSDLAYHVDMLNDLHRQLVGLNADVPTVPEFSAQLSTQVAKLRDSATAALNKNNVKEALKFSDLAVQMALKRPSWESTAQTLEEVGNMMAIRCDVRIRLAMWPEAYDDATLLCILKPQDFRNHVRKGRCLHTVQRYKEALAAYKTAQQLNPADSEVRGAIAEIEAM